MTTTDLFKPEFEPYREALAVFAAYRRLGFPTDSIHFVAAPEEKKTLLFMQLRYQGKDFIYGCGVVPHSAQLVYTLWQEIGRLWNEVLTREEQASIYKNALVSREGLKFITALYEKGFKIPYDDPGAIYEQIY